MPCRRRSCPLDLALVLGEIHNPEDRDFSFQPLSVPGLRTSIETTLLALMPHPKVLHSHAIDVIALSLLPEVQVTLAAVPVVFICNR